MGNCSSGSEVITSKPPKGAFQGTGHRLGAANEEVPLTATTGGGKKKDTANLPKPRVDPKLTSTERDQQRAERLAAAEARQKKLGGKPKKKKTSNNAPLTGPNSKPLMTWTAG